MISKILEAKKVLAYVLGLVVQLLSLHLVPAPAIPVATAVIAVATAVGIYQAENQPADPPGDHAADA